jgi:hypothetical protein
MSHRQAIKHTLARLGLQASAEEVVADLAAQGITVGKGLVQQVRIELLKKMTEGKGRETQRKVANRPLVFQRPKVPPRRS